MATKFKIFLHLKCEKRKDNTQFIEKLKTSSNYILKRSGRNPGEQDFEWTVQKKLIKEF